MPRAATHYVVNRNGEREEVPVRIFTREEMLERIKARREQFAKPKHAKHETKHEKPEGK